MRTVSTLQDILIGRDSITWGNNIAESCLSFPESGYYRRKNEQRVLPHAIGCQSPMYVSDYQLILQGTTGKFFNMTCLALIFQFKHFHKRNTWIFNNCDRA